MYPYPSHLGFQNQICEQCGVYHTQAHRCGGGFEVSAVEYVVLLCERSPIPRRFFVLHSSFIVLCFVSLVTISLFSLSSLVFTSFIMQK